MNTNTTYFWVLFTIIILSFSPYSHAEWVQATGKASVVNGQYDLARKQAREDALRQAAIQIGAVIEGHQEVSNGRLTRDEVSVTTLAKANKVVVIDETVDDGLLSLVIKADMVRIDRQQCSSDKANGYKKEIVLLGFSMQEPMEASIGALYDVDRALPGYLTTQLNRLNGLVVNESSQYKLYDELANAPTTETSQRTLTKAVHYARQMGVQFVVSGIVRDMSVVDPDAFGSSFLASTSRFLSTADRNRHFSLEVFIHDGFSGSIIFQKNYQLTAMWNADANDQTGFASPGFWKTEYGDSVGGLLNGVARDVNNTLRCQPFMTRITRAEGKTLHFASGASAGVRPGDELAVYRTYQFYNADLLAGTELTNAKAMLTVSQVHPSFGTGSIAVDAGRLNIQPDDLLIAW
jgi:hypothetical protein